MALQSSGAISFGDLRTEYKFGSNTAVSMADYYRGGSTILALAGNNTATNLSASVPTSGTISLNNFYSQEKGFQKTFSADASSQDASTIFGSDYSVDYPKRIVINSSVTISGLNGVDAIKYPSGADGTLTITNNGTISAAGSYCINNLSSQTVAVTNNGTVTSSDSEAFNSTFSGNGSAQMNFIGGQGGASAPDIYHSDYGGGFNCKLTRSGNTFTASWTYNELDYNNTGAGSYDCSSIFPLDGSGALNTSDTGEYVINTTYNYYGRDQRDLAFGSKIISGQRHFWFCSNAKATDLTLGSTMSYSQPGHTSVAVSTSNSRRSSILDSFTGADTNGSVTGV